MALCPRGEIRIDIGCVIERYVLILRSSDTGRVFFVCKLADARAHRKTAPAEAFDKVDKIYDVLRRFPPENDAVRHELDARIGRVFQSLEQLFKDLFLRLIICVFI